MSDIVINGVTYPAPRRVAFPGSDGKPVVFDLPEDAEGALNWTSTRPPQTKVVRAALAEQEEALSGRITALMAAVGTPLTASTAAGMTDTGKIYVYTGTTTGSLTNGHWYYHNGTAWTDGGVYNSAAVATDTTLSVSGQAADAERTGSQIAATDTKLAAYSKLVDYGGEARQVLNANPSSTGTTRLGVTREKCVFTLTGHSYSGAATRVRANGVMTRTDMDPEVKTWTTDNVALIPGHTYRIAYDALTATLDTSTVSISVYRAGEASTVGAMTITAKRCERIFTADTEAYNIVLYVAKDTVFSNDRLVMLLEDITEDQLDRDDRIDALHRLVDYGGNSLHQLNPNPTATNSTTLGIRRGKCVFTLSGKSYYAGDMRVRANGPMERTADGATVRTWTTDTVKLVPGRTYRAFYRILSGTMSPTTVSVSVYRAGESSTVGYAVNHSDGVERVFTADTTDYNIVLYFAQNTTYNQDKIMLLLEDITDLQNYYLEEMADTMAKVRGLMTEPALVFPLVTDIHVNTGDFKAYPSTIRTLRHFTGEVPCDFVVNLGDAINGDKSQALSLAEAYGITRDMMSLGLPYYYANGNHDNNPYSDASSSEKFTLAQDYQALFAGVKGVVPYAADRGTSYYKDLDGMRVRLVVLNSCNVTVSSTYGFSAGLAGWLEEEALDTDYTVLLMTHISCVSNQVWNNSNSARVPKNSAAVAAAVQAFADRGGRVIQLNGHSHIDYEHVEPWLSITSCSAKYNNVDLDGTGYPDITGFVNVKRSPERTGWTASECVWSVCVYKPWADEFDVIRFGAGVDRYFHLTPIAPQTVSTRLTGTVTWSSSDTAVATVSGGVISGAGSGRCAVIAKDAEGNIECWTVVVQ